MKKMRNKEREYSLIGFIALCQSRSSLVLSNQTGHLATPRFGLGPCIGARVASQRCPILRQGGPIIVEQEVIGGKIGHAIRRAVFRSWQDFPLRITAFRITEPKNVLASCVGKRVKTSRPERASYGRF